MYRYRITVEPVSPNAEGEAVQFEVDNHDDIAAIARRVPSRFGLDEDATKALIIGYKVLGEIVLKHRKEPPFVDLRPAMEEFGKSLRKQA